MGKTISCQGYYSLFHAIEMPTVRSRHWKLLHIDDLLGTSESGTPERFSARPPQSFLLDVANTQVNDVFLSI